MRKETKELLEHKELPVRKETKELLDHKVIKDLLVRKEH